MINCSGWPIGVCSWSLSNDFDKISALREQTQLNHIHLAVSPALGKKGRSYLSRVRKENWNIAATMIDFPHEDYSTLESIKVTGGIVPDKYWDDNRKRVFDAIDITAELGVKYLSFHFGFLDLINPDSAGKIIDRAKVLADKAGQKNIRLLMETGQETATELSQFLEELNHPALSINFDPANIILYGKASPIDAVKILAPWVKHIHIKDALYTQTPGTWGLEVPWSTGQVGGDEFLKVLKIINFNGVLSVERESGDNRFGDIKNAVDALTGFAG